MNSKIIPAGCKFQMAGKSFNRPVIWAIQHPYDFLIFAYVISRLIFLAVGCRFDYRNILLWPQIENIGLLKYHLARTLWYQHAQPPLYNLLIGWGVKLGFAAFPWFMWMIYAAVTLGGILSFHALARHLLRPWIALVLAAWMCVSPDVILYSQKLFYDGLVPGLACMTFWGIYSGLQRHSFARMLFGFAMLAMIILIRTMFHPLVFLLVLVPYLVVARGQRRRLLAAAAGPAAMIGAVLIKNALIFGFIGLSSWAPFNIAKTTVDQLPRPLMEELVTAGQLSPFAKTISFSGPAILVHYMQPIKPTGEPSLDDLWKAPGEPNWNHIIYVRAGKIRSNDARVALANDPMLVARVLDSSFYYFHRPSNGFYGLDANLAKIAIWTQISNAVIGLQPAAWHSRAHMPDKLAHPWQYIAYTSVMVTLLFFVAFTLFGVRTAIKLWRRRPLSLVDAHVAALMLTVTFILFVSSVFDTGENDRAHYTIAPLLLLCALLAVPWLRSATVTDPTREDA